MVCQSLGVSLIKWPTVGVLDLSFLGKTRPEPKHLRFGFLEINFSLSQTRHSWGHRVGQEAWDTPHRDPDQLLRLQAGSSFCELGELSFKMTMPFHRL